MIEKYSPGRFNKHIIRLTLNKDGYVGHISIQVGGNCTGEAIRETGITFFEDCDEDDILNLMENDCQLEVHTDDDYDVIGFSLCLRNGDKELMLDEVDEDDIKNIIVAAEIVDCTPEL